MVVMPQMEQDRKVRVPSGEQDRLTQRQHQIRLRCQFGFSAPAINVGCCERILVLEGHVESCY